MDDGDLFSGESIEKRGFADVGAADDRDDWQICLLGAHGNGMDSPGGFEMAGVKKVQPPVSAGYEGLLFPPEQSVKIDKGIVPQSGP